MATVVLDRAWLHDAANLDDHLAFFTTDRTDARSVGGAVRSYANGRLRLIRTADTAQQVAVTFRLVTGPQLDQLDAWAGAVLLYRDHMGRMFHGVYLALKVSDYRDRSGYDVAVSFARLDADFAV